MEINLDDYIFIPIFSESGGFEYVDKCNDEYIQTEFYIPVIIRKDKAVEFRNAIHKEVKIIEKENDGKDSIDKVPLYEAYDGVFDEFEEYILDVGLAEYTDSIIIGSEDYGS